MSEWLIWMFLVGYQNLKDIYLAASKLHRLELFVNKTRSLLLFENELIWNTFQSIFAYGY